MNIFSPNKILKYLDRIDEYVKTGFTCPIMADISLTDSCQHACPACVGWRANREELSAKKWAEIAKEMADWGVKSLKVAGGGESTLHPDYVQILKKMREAGLELGLVTNGTAFTEKDIKEVVKYCTWIRVSLDADTHERFEMVHGVGKSIWEKTIENIKLLAKHKGDCTIGVGYLVAENDTDWLPNAVRQAATWGVDYAQFRPFNNTQADISTALASARYLNRHDFKVLHSIHRFGQEFKREYGTCHAKFFIPGIATDGKVYPCCYLRGIEKYKVGDLREESFKEIMKKMDKAYFDFAACPVLCRGDVINIFIEQAKAPVSHEAFI